MPSKPKNKTSKTKPFPLNVDAEIADQFRDFCKNQIDDSQIKVAGRLLNWFMRLDNSTRTLLYRNEMLGPDQPALAITILERIAREGEDYAQVLASEALVRIANIHSPERPLRGAIAGTGHKGQLITSK